MSFLDTTLVSEEFVALSPEEKGLKSKDLFGETLKQSEPMRSAFSQADDQGKQAMLTNFRGALLKKFPEQYSKTIIRTGDAFEPDVEIIGEIDEKTGFPGPVIPRGTAAAVTEKNVLPILDPRSERFIAVIESGELTPESFLPEGKELKDLSQEDRDQLAAVVGIVNDFADSKHLSKAAAGRFRRFASDVVTQAGVSEGETLFKAGVGEGALSLGFFRDVISAGASLLPGQRELTPEQIRARQPFTSLELAARGEVIETARTVGAISTALVLGLASGKAIMALPASAAKKVGLTALAEAGIGVLIEPALPPITAELLGLEPGSFSSKALSALEGSLIGTIATLLPRSTRRELAKGFREIFGDLKSVKAAKPTVETIAADAAVIAKRYGVPIEEAQKVADKIFGKGFEPLARREEVVRAAQAEKEAAEAARLRQSPEGAQQLKEQLAKEEAEKAKVVAPKITPEQAAIDISTAAKVDDVFSPIDRAIGRARIQKAGSKPVTPEARRVARKNQLEETILKSVPDKAAGGQADALRGSEREDFFDQNVASVQRGAPEKAMVKATVFHAGIYSKVLENVGDLTHRIAQKGKQARFGSVKNKVESEIERLEEGMFGKSFAEVHEKNIINNAKAMGITAEEYKSQFDVLLFDYVEAHNGIPVFNKLQLLAQQAAVEVGLGNFDNALANLRKIKSAIDEGAESFDKATQAVDLPRPKAATVKLTEEQLRLVTAEAKADALIEAQQRKKNVEDLFDSTRIDQQQANVINRIEKSEVLSRIDKDQLIVATRAGEKALDAKIDNIATRRATAETADDAISVELNALKLERMPASKLSIVDVNTAKATLRLAEDVNTVSKLKKAEINELLIDPVPASQLKNTSKGELLDRFELEKNASIAENSKNIEVEAKQFEHDPDVRLEDSVKAEKPAADSSFEPSPTSKAAHKAEVDTPVNANTQPEFEFSDPSRSTAQKQAEVTGNDPTPPEAHGSSAAGAAHDRIIDRLSKRIVEPNPGKGTGGIISTKMLSDLAIVGADLISRGAKNFAAWSQEMIKRYGNGIRGSLGEIWASAKRAFNNIKNKISNTEVAFDHANGWSKGTDEKMSRRFAKNKVVRAIDYFTSPVLTRIARISGRVAGRVSQMEFDIGLRTNESLQRVEGFVDGMRGLEKSDKVLFAEVDRAFMNADISGARDLIVKSEMDGKIKDQLLKGIDDVKAELASIRDAANEAGMDVGFVEDYMPRVVTDHKGLLNSFGLEQRTAIEKIWAEEAARINRKLTSAERAELANRYLQRGATGQAGGKLSFEKKRKYNKISVEMQPFYGKTHENLQSYISQMQNRIQMQKALGGGKKVPIRKNETTEMIELPDGSKMVRVTNSPPQLIDYDEKSLGALIDEVNPNLKFDDREELLSLLRSRFVEGEQAGADIVQNARNIGYIATMGHYLNTITQLGDLWPTIRIRPRSFVAGVKGAFGFSDDAVSTLELGIKRIMEEHNTNPMRTSRWLHSLFGHTKLRALDMFGKDVFLNAALDDFQKIAKGSKSKKALVEFKEKHIELFGEEFTDKLIKDLQTSKRSYETDAAIFHEITGVQPLTKSQMPQFYLDNPNGRIFMMLKTWTLKAMDQVRREGIDELLKATDLFRAGKIKEATAKSAIAVGKITLILAGGAGFEAVTADIIKDLIRGKPVTADTISDAAMANLQRFLFMNKHITKRFAQKGAGGVEKWITGVLMIPPVSIADQLIHDGMLALEGDLSLNTAESTYMILGGGDVYWWRFTEAGQKRIKEIEQEISQGKDPLFANIFSTQKKATRDRKELKELIDGDLIHLEDLASDTDKVRYMQQLKAKDPVRWQKTRRKMRAQRVEDQLKLTDNEKAFKKKSSDVRAAQLAKVINGMASRQKKAAFYQEMIRKRIITRSVKRLLDPQLRPL